MSVLRLKFDDDDPWIIEQRMFNLLDDYLQPASTISVLDTAQALDSLFPTHRSDEDQPQGEPREPPESFLLHMWPLFLNIAVQIPHDHPAQDKLAELVKTLKSLVSKTPIAHIDGSDTELWKDLPLLFPTIEEELERRFHPFPAGIRDNVLTKSPEMSNCDEKSKQSRRNASSFLARLTRDHTADWFALAICEVGGRLEGHVVFRHAHAHRGTPVLDFIPERDQDIESAFDWISICGHVLFSLDVEVERSGGGPLWEGKLGLCPERWQLWKRRLGGLAAFDGVSERTRELAKETRDRMEVVERDARGQ